MPVPRYIDSVGGGRHNRDGRTRPKSQSQGTALQFTGILSSVDPPFRTRHRHGLSYCRVRSFPVDWHAPENSMTGWFFSRRPLLVLSCLVLSVGIGTGVVGSGTSASGRSKQNLEEDRLTLRYLLDPVPSPVGSINRQNSAQLPQSKRKGNCLERAHLPVLLSNSLLDSQTGVAHLHLHPHPPHLHLISVAVRC